MCFETSMEPGKMAGRQRCPTVDWETGSIFRNSSAVAGLVTNHSNSHLSLSLQGTGESPLCYSSTLGLSLSYLSVYKGKNPKDHQLSPALAAGAKAGCARWQQGSCSQPSAAQHSPLPPGRQNCRRCLPGVLQSTCGGGP